MKKYASPPAILAIFSSWPLFLLPLLEAIPYLAHSFIALCYADVEGGWGICAPARNYYFCLQLWWWSLLHMCLNKCVLEKIKECIVKM